MAKADKGDYQVISIEGDLLKKLQKVELSILKDIAQFCDENQITYFLTSGTLLGAIRHQGFIPWDDDVDISMPRKDFEKFLSLKDKLPDNYVCVATRFDSNYPIPIVKVRKKNTVMKESAMAKLDICHGIWIDIFPLDKVKDVEALPRRVRGIALITTAINYKLGISGNLKLKTKVFCLFISLLTVKQLDRIRTRLMAAEEESDGYLLTSFASNIGYKRLLLNENVYLPPKTGMFENLIFKIPSYPEKWLSAAYGDYLILPPEDKRVNRHKVVEISFEE